jgi:sirohydrochlorin ferrochelatase
LKALVIVGHGSHLNEDSSLPVYEHARRIRECFGGEYDEVVECFWKEEPSMRHVLDTVEAEDVCVVPAFISEGYGTDLNKNSGGVIYLNADRIRERNLYDLVEVGFLDQDPEIGRVVENAEAENVVLIPVFIAEGWHTRETIPEDLGLTGEVTARRSKTIYYGAPVGTHPSMAGLIAARARETERGTEVVRSIS